MGALSSRTAAFAVGGLALASWAVCLFLEPASALQGWLIAFVFWSSLGWGALAVLLIHRLTGGRWGEALRPELEPVAWAAPWLCLFAVPVLVGTPLIYSWARAGGMPDPAVAHFYLNTPLFILRSAAALIVLGAVGAFLPRIEAARSGLTAGLALSVYALAASVVGVDWILSLRPQWTSSDFGMSFVVLQFATALAWAAVRGAGRLPEGRAGDLAGLLFACLIALTYLQFMDYLVVWYGDRPTPDAWYLMRLGGWNGLVWATLGVGVLLPIVLLGVGGRLGAHRAVRWAGGTVLVGAALYEVWLLAPAFGPDCLVPAGLAFLAMGGVWLALTGGRPSSATAGKGQVAHAH